MLICKDCFHDEELSSAISANARNQGICEVCGSKGKVATFSEYNDFFEGVLSLFVKNEKSSKTIVDIIQEDWNLFANKEIAHTLLEKTIATSNPGFSIDSLVDYTDEIRERVAVWDTIKTDIKEKYRFFPNIREFMDGKYLQCGENGLSEGSELFRARVTPAGGDTLKIGEMGCPPKSMSTAGRANPIGIPYLYLCDSAKTTYYEVRAVYLDNLSVGTFKVTRPLRIVDFTHNVSLYNAYNSDVPFQEIVIKKKIVDAISADLSKPLRRYDTELEYVPTQFICEYCRYELKADGISFESSLHKGGRNHVLFDESSAECIKVENHEITKIDIDRN